MAKQQNHPIPTKFFAKSETFYKNGIEVISNYYNFNGAAEGGESVLEMS